MLRLYYEKESVAIESSNSFNCFNKIKKFLTESYEDINGINILKEDLDWFQGNEEKIMNSFRVKFHEAIKIMVIFY